MGSEAALTIYGTSRSAFAAIDYRAESQEVLRKLEEQMEAMPATHKKTLTRVRGDMCACNVHSHCLPACTRGTRICTLLVLLFLNWACLESLMPTVASFISEGWRAANSLWLQCWRPRRGVAVFF